MLKELKNNQDPKFLYSVVELCRKQIKDLTGHDWIHNRVGDNIIIAELLNKLIQDGGFKHNIVGQYDIISSKYGNIDIKKFNTKRNTVVLLDKIHDEATLEKFNKTDYFVLLKSISYEEISFIVMKNNTKMKRKIRSIIKKRVQKEKSGKKKKYHSLDISFKEIVDKCQTLVFDVSKPFERKTIFKVKNNHHKPIYGYDEKTNKKTP